MSEENKDMVRHLVEAINAGEEDAAIGQLFAPRAARRVKRLFGEFRKAFPDWQEEIVELVAEGDTVAGPPPSAHPTAARSRRAAGP